jgi:WD40 repeat protein
MDINSKNPDLIAVSYGEYDINLTKNKDKELKQGILAFWTLKNPTFPEKYIMWDYNITSCMFSRKQPHLIAIGDSQGNVAIFNIRSDDLSPIATTKDLEDKHRDIVWEVKWVDRGPKPETLISVAGDGRVIQWSMKRGLDMYELFSLKRETNPNQKDVF